MKNNPRPRITTIAYHVALWPVVLGVAIVLVWYLVRFSWLPIAGIILFYIAVPVNFIVAAVLIFKWNKNIKLPRENRVVSKIFYVPLLALALNYYVAYLCFTVGGSIGDHVDILIVNKSSFMLKNVKALDSNGNRVTIPSIDSNDKASIFFNPQGNGPVTVSFTADGKEIVTTPIGHVTWGSDNVATLELNENLAPRIQWSSLDPMSQLLN